MGVQLIQNRTVMSAILALAVAGYQPVVLSADLDLVMAAKNDDTTQIEALLKTGVDVNIPEADGATALSWAVYNDDTNAVEQLIQAGADVNAANEYGINPLHLACANQNAEIVSLLLKANAKPDNPKLTGETPLMTCAGMGVVAAVQQLIDSGANVNVVESEDDQTALMWAAAEKHADVVKLLVDNGAQVNAKSRIVPFAEPHIIKVPSVTGLNFTPSIRFRKFTGGFTALQFAAQQGDLESARAMLETEAGADLDYSNEENGTALMVAIASGHEELGKYLLEKGANPNVKDWYGLAPLHYALHQGVLIMNGQSPFGSDKLGWERKNMPGMVKALLEFGADPNVRVDYEYPKLDNEFLRSNDNPSQIHITGATPLHLAAASGDMESMRILMEHGADISLKTAGGASVLLLAAGGGAEAGMRDEQQSIEVAKLAMSMGDKNINVSLTDKSVVNGPGAGKADGRTIAHFAVTTGWKDMISFLAENKANLDVPDRYGMTPLMLAMGDPESRYYRSIGIGRYDDRYRRIPANEDIEKLLLQLGAKPFTGKRVRKGSVD